MGSNGLTSARHDVLNKYYLEKYPESFDPNTDTKYLYAGSKRLTDKLDGTPLDYGKALLSPTKTYAPVIKTMLQELPKQIHSLVHCTGGAQTKVLHFIDDLKIIKDHLFPTPPLFSAIQKESGTSWQEMYKVFNMGHRMEIYTNKKNAQAVIDIANSFNIEAQIIGRVEAYKGKQVEIKTENGTFIYQ